MDGSMDRRIDGWMDRWINGWADGWQMDGGWVDEWMDGWIFTSAALHHSPGSQSHD